MNSQRLFERPELYLAWFTALMGVVNLISAAAPAVVSRMEIINDIFPFEVRAGTRLATAFIGFILLLLASGVSRRKRVAWLISLPTLIISSIFHLIKGLDYEAAIVSVILIVLLIVSRKRFTAKSDPPTIRRGLTVMGIAVVFVLLYGTLGLYFLESHLPTPYQPGQALSQTLAMFFEFKPPTLVPLTRYGKFFVNSIYVLGIVVIGYALYAILSPVILREESRDVERENAEKIIREHGRTVLARFCLFKDKKYFFSPGGSVISFTTNRGVAVVLGDPIGPIEDARAAISEFRDFCVTNDWLPAFYQTLPDYLEEYKSAGLRALKIGEEAIVKLSDFQLAGGEMKSVRTSVNKMTRLGFSQEVMQPPYDPAFLDALEKVSNEWMLEQNGKEMKFSMGWFDREYLNTTPVLVVRDNENQVVAFANLVGEYQNNELAVDLMRHRSSAPAGVMDFLFVSMLTYAREAGYATFNLGLSGLAGVGESSADPAIEKAMHFIYTSVNTAYNYKGLHAFKQKFNPTWEPRYLIHPGVQNLPAVALAISAVSS
jgi:phosphatidylglycerol lysyltransferase